MVPAGPGLTGWSSRDITAVVSLATPNGSGGGPIAFPAVAGHAVKSLLQPVHRCDTTSPATVTRTYPGARRTRTISARRPITRRLREVSPAWQLAAHGLFQDAHSAPWPRNTACRRLCPGTTRRSRAPRRAATIRHESSPPTDPVTWPRDRVLPGYATTASRAAAPTGTPLNHNADGPRAEQPESRHDPTYRPLPRAASITLCMLLCILPGSGHRVVRARPPGPSRR